MDVSQSNEFNQLHPNACGNNSIIEGGLTDSVFCYDYSQVGTQSDGQQCVSSYGQEMMTYDQNMVNSDQNTSDQNMVGNNDMNMAIDNQNMPIYTEEMLDFGNDYGQNMQNYDNQYSSVSHIVGNDVPGVSYGYQNNLNSKPYDQQQQHSLQSMKMMADSPLVRRRDAALHIEEKTCTHVQRYSVLENEFYKGNRDGPCNMKQSQHNAHHFEQCSYDLKMCKLCVIIFESPLHARDHYNGKAHWKKVKIADRIHEFQNRQRPSESIKYRPDRSESFQYRSSPSENIKYQPDPSESFQYRPSPSESIKYQPDPSDSFQYRPNPSESIKYQPDPSQSFQYRPSPSESIKYRPDRSESFQRRLSPSESIKHRPDPSESFQYRPSPSESFKYQSDPSESIQHRPGPSENTQHRESIHYRPGPSESFHHRPYHSERSMYRPSPSERPRVGGRGRRIDCKLCGIFVTSPNELLAHYNGAKHKAKLEAKQNETIGSASDVADYDNNTSAKVNSRHIECKLCGIFVTSPNELLAHYNGAKHKAKLEAKQNGTAGSASYVADYDDHTSAKVNSRHIECKLCGIFVTSPNELLAHYNGAKHQAKLNAKNGDNNCHSECKLCGIFVTSPSELLIHFKGSKHQLKLEAKATNDSAVAQNHNASTPENTLKSILKKNTYIRYCTICSLHFDSEKESEKHFIAPSHVKRQNELLSTTNVSDTKQVENGGSYQTDAKEKEGEESNCASDVADEDKRVKNLAETKNSNDSTSGNNLKSKFKEEHDNYCNICFVNFDSFKESEEHFISPRHVQRKNEITTTNASGTEFGKSECEVCGISLSSAHQLSIHIKGAKHKARLEGRSVKERRLKSSTKFPDIEDNNSYCTLCFTSFQSAAEAAEHYQGMPHLSRKNDLSSSSEIFYSLKDKTENSNCYLCGEFVGTVQDMDHHLLGEKHQENLISGLPVVMKVDDQHMICRVCNVKIMNVSRNLSLHLASKGHKLKAYQSNADKCDKIPNVMKIHLDNNREFNPNCYLCGEFVGAVHDMNHHLRGEKHQENLIRGLPVIAKVDGKFMICRVCNVRIIDAAGNLSSHLAGKNHQLKACKSNANKCYQNSARKKIHPYNDRESDNPAKRIKVD